MNGFCVVINHKIDKSISKASLNAMLDQIVYSGIGKAKSISDKGVAIGVYDHFYAKPERLIYKDEHILVVCDAEIYNFKDITVYRNIDELSEADILEKKVRAAEMALNGIRGAGGLIDIEEARRIFNDGQIKLDPKKKIKVRERMESGTPQGGNAGDGDSDNNSTKPDLYKSQLDAETLEMIKKRKEQIVKKEKELGEEILREQDEHADNVQD